MTPPLSDLREPPVAGRFYLVPVVRDYPYYGRRDTWPVIGPKHADADFFRVSTPHYHLDARFLTKAQVEFIASLGMTPDGAVGRSLLANAVIQLPKGRPEIARRKCRASTSDYAYRSMKEVQALCAHFGEPAAPIALADGRRLCPHRKADLSSFPPDAAGDVICPLHGLKVRIAA